MLSFSLFTVTVLHSHVFYFVNSVFEVTEHLVVLRKDGGSNSGPVFVFFLHAHRLVFEFHVLFHVEVAVVGSVEVFKTCAYFIIRHNSVVVKIFQQF